MVEKKDSTLMSKLQKMITHKKKVLMLTYIYACFLCYKPYQVVQKGN